MFQKILLSDVRGTCGLSLFYHMSGCRFLLFITSFVLKYEGFHNKYDYIGVVAEETVFNYNELLTILLLNVY